MFRSTTVLLALALALATPSKSVAQHDGAAQAQTLAFDYAADFAGWDSEDRVNLWTGTVQGAVDGHLQVRLDLQLPDERANERVWPVRVRWLVRDSPHAFEAELYGSADWRTGRMSLQGRVLRGWCRDCAIAVEGRHSEVDGTGRVTMTAAGSVAVH